MSYNAKDWHDKLTIRRGIKLDIPTAVRKYDGYGEYYVYSGSEDPEYMRQCRAAMEHSVDPEARARERLRTKRAAELFTEIWLRRMAGESLDDIEESEAA